VQVKLFRKLLRLAPLLLVLALLASAQQSPAPESEEHHVSKDEAKELFRSIDDILRFASERTGLPIKRPVKKKLATRDEVAKYIQDRLKEQGSGERFDRSALPLKKLGLLPRDFNLRQYMLGLYKEQVEGWYDAHNKTVYLLDWVEPDVQKPVMAHELVHALQDQNFGLEKWLNVAKDSKDDTAQVALEEARTARQAVVEGQAMIVLYDYELSDTNQSVESAPDAVESMKGSMIGEDSTPMYSQAPLYLRESMLFPYNDGMEFIRAILMQRGKQPAFAGVFDHPPADSRQIMQPATYLANEPQPQIKVAPLDTILGPGWQREDVDGIGEIDLSVILRQWSAKNAAAKDGSGKEPDTALTHAWRGGYYMALSQKNAPRGARNDARNDAPISLALVLDFASHDAANRFAAIYQSGLTTRYHSVHPTPTPHQWDTEEGLVSLYIDDTRVIALESFTSADAAKLHAALLPPAAAAAH
jgi:hypothetical protein